MQLRDASPARSGAGGPPYGSLAPRGLVARVTPFPDESLAGLVQRAAALNGFSTAGDVLQQAGFKRQHPGAITRSIEGNGDGLAEVLGVAGGLGPMLTPRVPGRRGWHEFFGTPMRVLHQEWKVRRVSPRGLRQSLHLRAVWSLRPLSFDPATKEQLVDACPECRRKLNFFGARGVQFCDRCTRTDARGFVHGAIDLRDFPQPIVEVDDVEALDFFTGLVDPGTIGWTARHSPHDDLKGLSHGMVFEIGLALASAITADPKRVPGEGDSIVAVSDYGRLKPDVLARAGRALLTWPRGFQNLAEEIRSSAHLRGGRFGLAKEFGPLLALQRSRWLEPAARDAIRKAIGDGIRLASAKAPTAQRKGSLSRSDLLTSTEAGKMLGCQSDRFIQVARASGIVLTRSEGSRTAPVLAARRDVEAILEERRSAVPRTYPAKALGLSVACVERLAQRRFFNRALAYEERWSVTRPYYERDSVDACLARLRAATQGSQPPAGLKPLFDVVKAAQLFNPDPWGDALGALLDGRLRAWMGDTSGLPLVHLLEVEGPDALRCSLVKPDSETVDSTVVDRQQAAVALGVKAEIVRWLEADGFIPVPTTIGSLRSFAEKYAHTTEACRLVREVRPDVYPSTIADFLKDSGLAPAATVTPRGRYLWNRADLEVLVATLRRDGSIPVVPGPARTQSRPESRVLVSASLDRSAPVDFLVAV